MRRDTAAPPAFGEWWVAQLPWGELTVVPGAVGAWRRELVERAALEQVLARLEHRADAIRDLLRDYDELRARVRSLFDSLAAAEWMPRSALGSFENLSSDAALALEHAMPQLLEVERSLVRLAEMRAKAEVLAARLSEVMQPVSVVHGSGLAGLEAVVAARVADLERRMAALAELEHNAVTIVQELESATADASIRLIAENPLRLAALGGFLVGRRIHSALGERLRTLREHPDLIGTLVAVLCASAPDLAAPLLATLSARFDAGEDVSAALADLPASTWQALIELQPVLFAPIAGAALAAAVATDENSLLDYLAPCVEQDDVSGPLIGPVRALCEARRRGQFASVRAAFGQARKALQKTKSAGRTEASTPGGGGSSEIQQRLIAVISNEPGMSGHYHKLRVEARVELLLPLRPLVLAGDAIGALAAWQKLGSVDDLVTRSIRSYARRAELGETHRSQLQNYLESVDRLLKRWVGADATSEAQLPATVVHAWTSLFADIDAGRVSGLDGVVKTIGAALASPGDFPLRDFGQRTVTSPELALPGDDRRVTPCLPWSFARAVERDAVDLRLFLAERLRAIAGGTTLSVADAVELFLAEGRWQVARAAARGDAALETLVMARAAAQREALQQGYVELLRQAEEARAQDELVDLAFGYFREALEDLAPERVHTAALDLEKEVRRFQVESDPRRKQLRELLAEAGAVVVESESTDLLQSRFDALSAQATERRIHIDEFSRLDPALPLSLRESWMVAAQQLDRPGLWPSERMSGELAECIDYFNRYLRGRLKHRQDSAEVTDLLVRRLEMWLPAQLRAALSGDEAAVSSLLGLREEIRDFAPAGRVLQLLGETAPPQRVPIPAPTPALVRGEVQSRSQAVTSPGVPETISAAELYTSAREYLGQRARAESAAMSGVRADLAQLRQLALGSDWNHIRLVAAACVEARSGSSDRLSGQEAVYAVAVLRTQLSDAASERLALAQHVVAAVLDNPDADYYLVEEARRAALVDALAAISGAPTSGARMPDRLADALSRLCRCHPTDPVLAQAAQLFGRATALPCRDGSPGSSRLARHYWDAFSGERESADRRSNLLHLLYRLRRSEALRSLSIDAKPYDEQLMQAINAFEKAESAPEVRPRTLQISAAIREQARGKNVKAWTLLFALLERSFGDVNAGEVLTARVEAGDVTEADGIVTIPIHLVPPLHDAPVRLSLQLNSTDSATDDGTALLSDDEILLKERVVPLAVRRDLLGPPGEELRVPYRITGRTIRGNPVDVRGAWTIIPRSRGRAEPLQPEDVQRAWPGAKGEPLTLNAGFFGRERERREIKRHVLADDRPRSVMLFGQRRVGKTSLLYQMIEELPPREGGIAGAFLDVSGLEAGTEPFPRALFNWICAALDTHERNELLRNALQQAQGQRIEITKLARGLNTSSLFYALEGLVERLREKSRGRISRLALFIDEFDRFVEPLLRGQQKEVENLMWQVRQIVQQSRNVSLVLAGSGLQRMLSERYDTALFGSIAQVEVGPFRKPEDREAVEKTFLPEVVRSRLCSLEEFGVLVDTAYDLSGGYPFYLTMLGYSAGLLAAGHGLTPASLHRAADEMVRGGVPNVSWRIDAGRFYLHVFETAQRLPQRLQAVVKLVLAYLAQQTSRDFPTVPKDIIDSADLGNTTESERQKALDFLITERVVDIDRRTGRPTIRIGVPLTASAVREMAVEIQNDAMQALRATKGFA